MARLHRRRAAELRGTGDQQRPPLLCVYARLNELLDAVHCASESCEAPAEQASYVILEEDLRCLMEECEEYLLSGLPHGARSLRAFLTRSLTVMEESREILTGGKVVSLAVIRCSRALHSS